MAHIFAYSIIILCSVLSARHSIIIHLFYIYDIRKRLASGLEDGNNRFFIDAKYEYRLEMKKEEEKMEEQEMEEKFLHSHTLKNVLCARYL